MRTLWQVILHKPSSRSDAALLHSFVESKSEEAFSALVERHGGMVLGVCQRVLGHSQDAEDAFQATFLVLAQKAARLHGNSSLGPWLYGVAQRVAMKARSKRPVRAPYDEEFAAAPEDHPMNGEELRPIIDEEIARLPDHYRSVFVLCELQELTKAEAARQLSVPEGTVSSRLMRAREILRGRLLQRGVTLGSLAALDGLLVPGSVSAHLAQTAVSTAMKVALGTTLSASVSSTVLHLAQGATPAMVLSKLQMAAVGLVLATGLSVGTGYVAGGWGQEKNAAKPADDQVGGDAEGD
ncbi:MAG: sigma-70 family RNA polymerase sigma factor [Gemmatales bacterium]